jgi:Synergist-CTERM protein sorting domain-containing protein
VTEKVFAHLRPYKQFGHTTAVDLVGETGNYWPFFFETGYNPEEESVTVQFRMVLLDDERSGVTLAKKRQVGFFPLFDGARDGVFRDPLALSYRAATLTVPPGADALGVLPNPLPTGTITPSTPTPGASGGGGDSGCNGGFGGAATILLLLPMGVLFRKI